MAQSKYEIVLFHNKMNLIENIKSYLKRHFNYRIAQNQQDFIKMIIVFGQILYAKNNNNITH